MSLETNKQAFEQLLNAGYDVDCPSGISLSCRRMPFTTVTYVLSTVAESTQNEIVRARGTIVRDLQALLRVDEAAAPEQRQQQILAAVTSADGIQRLLNMLSPVIGNLLALMPEMLERVLRDVIVGATSAVVQALPVEDGLHIIAASFSRMDKGLLARQITDVFFGLSETISGLTTAPSTDEPPKSEPPSTDEEQG